MNTMTIATHLVEAYNFAPRSIFEIRSKWQDALSDARFLAIVGVSHNQYDSHIVESIEKLAAPIFYIGGKRDFDNWLTREAKTM